VTVADTPDRQAAPPENSASLRLSTGPLAGPVLCRVVSMVLARANCPMDRLDDAMLICDAIAAHAPLHALDGHLTFKVTARPGTVELRVGELAAEGGRKLLQSADVPGVGNVLERVSDELLLTPSSDNSSEELLLVLKFA
jgi:hypothetical protein